MGIEVIEREVAEERKSTQDVFHARVLADQERLRLETQKNRLEAEMAWLVLTECEGKIQAQYNKSNRSTKDRLCTVLLQIANSKEELCQVHTDLVAKK